MVASSVVDTLELAVEFKSPADKFWEALKTWSSILPEVLPETYTSIEVVADVDGEKNGSVTLWKMNPIMSLISHLFPRLVLALVLKMKLMMILILLMIKLKKKDEKEGGGTVKWSLKYEKVNEMVHEANMVKSMIYKTILILDEHVLSKQNEVVEQDKHILSKQNEVEQKEQTEVITD
ncbi:hypothetical protein MKX03_024372 [Papaver bracteatum]|nr:hypothetical protein MKX03_024372 [Papaver bracteatum]